jgi:REP element-mobilizing transposase RayT
MPGEYHVYNRARGGRAAFVDDRDRREFIALLNRYSRQFAGLVEVHAYCLMTTHFHLIVSQLRPAELERFMTGLSSAYVRYSNRRHGTGGSLFDGPYRARRLTTRKDFRWSLAYVHDNHPTGREYEFSNHRAFLDADERPGWLRIEPALAQFGAIEHYQEFFADRNLRKQLQARFFDLR